MKVANIKEREIRANELVTEAKLANFAFLANMLLDLFGLDVAFQKYVKPKREGQIVEMHFPTLNGSITFILTRDRKEFQAQVKKPENPVAKVIINVKREKTTLLAGKIIRLKSNIFGLMRIFPHILTRKLKIKGSWAAAIALCRVLMVGKNQIYKEK